ncbi:hypothetical protein AVEN_52686-1 [Araneus ventricosus]|uniref:Uncharacterized protein n=1 Tax=Araneus ventricosus TaxID=182803 RepID=A0A4Y2EM59_ARAVE|nr:hypothetical protein AVEN_52686-1 [Araneus ventricosus]
MELNKFLKSKFNDALQAQKRFNIYQENYNRLKSDKNAPCPEYKNEIERKIEVVKLSNYCESKHNDTSSKVYNIYQENCNEVKSYKNAFCPEYRNKNETGVKIEVTKLSNECDSKSNGISRKHHNPSSHFESRYPEQEIDNSGGSDLDVCGSASTVSFPDARGRRQYNVPQKIQREAYPVHVVRPCIIIKKQKEAPKENFTVVQKGNFFEIVSLTPKSNKLLK